MFRHSERDRSGTRVGNHLCKSAKSLPIPLRRLAGPMIKRLYLRDSLEDKRRYGYWTLVQCRREPMF